MKEITTIKVHKITKARLDRLKEHEKESYEQVIRKILYILNTSRKNPEKATRMFRKLDSIIKRKESYKREQEQSIKE